VDVFKKHLFYSDAIRKEALSSIRGSYSNNMIQLKNVSYIGCDQKSKLPEDVTVVYDSECGSPSGDEKYLKIARLKDGGADFRIYNDVSCNAYLLKPYPSNFSIDDLDIEHMKNKTFCETYITQ